jgi:hypothetical protein
LGAGIDRGFWKSRSIILDHVRHGGIIACAQIAIAIKALARGVASPQHRLENARTAY